MDFKFKVEFVLTVSTDIDVDKKQQLEFIKVDVPHAIRLNVCGSSVNMEFEIDEGSIQIEELP